MPESKRQCSKCQFFQSVQLSGNGWCTHPSRQVASDLKILVRERELACRNTWGDDLWVDASPKAAGQEALPTPRKGLFFTNRRADDEVTSVVDTTSKQPSGPHARTKDGKSEDIVTFTSVRPDDGATPPIEPRSRANDLNGPANADQAERVHFMSRGSKDAVEKARERHTQRHKPVRKNIAADPARAGSDQILTAQDRDQYARATRPGVDPPRDALRDTPPVPREEVQAGGNALSPASGSDARFDSVPQLKPEVDLTVLRGFLNRSGSGATKRSAGAGDVPAVTSYDLVLRRAQEVKAADNVERDYHRHLSQESHVPDLPPAPEPPEEPRRGPAPATHASKSGAGVVWDVDGERLDIAFERARAAIEQTVSRVSIPPDSTRENAGHTGGAPVRFDRSRPAASFDDPDQFMEAAGFGSGVPDRDDDDPFEPEAESPRGSWWRSLNFGHKRRYRSDPVFHPSYPYDDDLATDGEDAASAVGAGFPDDRSSDCDVADESIDPGVGYRVGSSIAIDEADDREPVFATSEESWIRDEWEFPDPQPMEWHTARTQMLTFQPAPLVEEDSPASWRERVTVAATTAIAAMPSPGPEPSFFAIDEPAGLDAFRAALFGNDAAGVPMAFARAPEPASRQTRGYPPALGPAGASTGDSLTERSPNEFSRPSTGYRHGRPARGSMFPREHGAFDTDFDIRNAIEDEEGDFERQFDVASRVTKSCSTCRSFRPSENGERGWCMNDWSATHRQMVNSDDLACRSSIGDWWLAADSSWIPPTDAIHPETPRTDRLNARSDPRQDSGKRNGQRVRTSKVV